MSASRPEQRVYHQDYIARIRYSNALPPPPNPPKLLDIPNTGLASGQYTSAGFASRLAREQPLNIEADAELGMPIDLIGLPGVFDGDESAIMALDNPPPPHPHDKPLLRPLGALGKPTATIQSVSFLRRTEYISSAQSGMRFESSTSKDLLKARANARKKQRSDVNKEDPTYMARSIIKGFDIAYPREAYRGPDTEDNLRAAEITAQEQDAWNNPRHPTRSDLKLLDSYPLIPDLEALPDLGSYIVTKFLTNPVAASDKYDDRLDVGLLRVLDPTPELQARRELMEAARREDPTQPSGNNIWDYEFYLASKPTSVRNIKRKLSTVDPDRDNPALYDEDNGIRPCFRYDRIRAYETYSLRESSDVFGDTVAIALHDPDQAARIDTAVPPRKLLKAAYFYPVAQRANIRPRRAPPQRMGVAASQRVDKPSDSVDVLEVSIEAPNEEDLAVREEHRMKYEGPAVAAEG